MSRVGAVLAGAALLAVAVPALAATPAATVYACLTSKHTLVSVSVTNPPTCLTGQVPVQWQGQAGPPDPSPPPTTASPPPSPTDTSPVAWACVTSAMQGECGPWAYPQIEGTNSGNEDKNLTGNNMFSPGSQTLHANSPGDWMVTANWPAGNTGVESYPSLDADYHEFTGGTWVGRPLSSFATMVSSFSETMNATPGTSAWAAYDIWLNGGADEVMIQHDFANNGACDAVTTTTFGGQDWHLCVFGPEKVWKLGTDDAHQVSEQSGSVDLEAMLTWLEDHSYIPQGSTIGDIGYGWEICSTGGVPENFQVSSFSINVTV